MKNGIFEENDLMIPLLIDSSQQIFIVSGNLNPTIKPSTSSLILNFPLWIFSNQWGLTWNRLKSL